MNAEANLKEVLSELYQLDAAICDLQRGLAVGRPTATSEREGLLMDAMLKTHRVTLTHVRNIIFKLEGK